MSLRIICIISKKIYPNSQFIENLIILLLIYFVCVVGDEVVCMERCESVRTLASVNRDCVFVSCLPETK